MKLMTDKHLLSSDSYPVYHLKIHMKGHIAYQFYLKPYNFSKTFHSYKLCHPYSKSTGLEALTVYKYHTSLNISYHWLHFTNNRYLNIKM